MQNFPEEDCHSLVSKCMTSEDLDTLRKAVTSGKYALVRIIDNILEESRLLSIPHNVTIACIDVVLDHGVTVDIVLFHAACVHKHSEITKSMLEKGANPQYKWGALSIREHVRRFGGPSDIEQMMSAHVSSISS